MKHWRLSAKTLRWAVWAAKAQNLNTILENEKFGKTKIISQFVFTNNI